MLDKLLDRLDDSLRGDPVTLVVRELQHTPTVVLPYRTPH